MNYSLYVILNIFIYNSLSLYFINLLIKNKSIELRKNNLFWFIFLLLCLYCLYSGDWLHYREKLEFYEIYGDSGLEQIYNIILFYIGNNYLLFRLIVWGTAIFFLKLLFERISVNYYRLLGFYAIWGMLFFAYARVSLGLSLFFYGYSFLVKPINKRYIGYFWGLLCLILGIVCHKSILLLLTLLPFTFFSFSKKKFLIYGLCGCSLIYLINYFLQSVDFLLLGMDGLEYLSAEVYSRTLGKLLVDYFVRTPLFLLLAYLLYKLLWGNRFSQLSVYIQHYAVYSILIFLLALVFYFINIENQVLYYRTLYMIFIPLSIVLADVYIYVSKKIIILFTIMAYIGCNMWLLYSFIGHLNGTIQ